MALNWIHHTVENTPSFLTSEDLKSVGEGVILNFYQGLKFLSNLRSTFPSGLELRLRVVRAQEYCSLLEHAISSGAFMDTGWVDQYFSVAQEMSCRMRGYPKECKAQWRELREAVVKQEARGWDEQPVQSRTQRRDPLMPKLAKKSFRFLDLPNNVRNEVYMILFLREAISIGDWDFDWLETQSKNNRLVRRTEYDVFDHKRKTMRRTTYTARSLGKKIFMWLNIMQVNKQIHKEAAQIFYGENKFQFLGTVESALAFLHDRANKLDILKKVSIRFMADPYTKFKGCYNWTCKIFDPPRTFHGSWRRICNLFVHSSLGLEDFNLAIDSSFWLETPWEQGVDGVFNTPRLCEPRDIRSWGWRSPQTEWGSVTKNFLQHAARLGGVNLRLTIDRADEDPEREAFRKGLEKRMQEEAFKRPYLADDSVPRCSCRKRLLKECCIWDREGKMRRG
ncbi:hypothetical protein K402DRAFT_420221 [Aulographum hederae CBS 113979]|uniref:Uncharacterized protein n=1 Tax=Aulographum hederae CBS 113979 TaxID=1176131 RepID=A0A6G1H2K7_9PEZI|nr:hypothetical protein K402DRAFT_420221 [Aulographum hederae CBS 113979]